MADTVAEKCFLFRLPTEIILHIGACAHGNQDLSRLCRAHSFLHRTLDSLLYRRDAQEHRASALRWAAKHGDMPTARRSLAAGPALDDRQVLNLLVRIHGDQSRRGIKWQASCRLKRPSGRVRRRRDILCLLLQHGAAPEMDLLYVATAVAMQTGGDGDVDGELLDLLRDGYEALRRDSQNGEVDWLRSYPLLHAGVYGTPVLFNQFLPDVRARLRSESGIADAGLLASATIADIVMYSSPDMLACLLENKLVPTDILVHSLHFWMLLKVLYFAVPVKENLDRVKLLLESGLVWNLRNRLSGRTLFAECCASGCAEVTELLLESPKIDPNLADLAGQSPYLLALDNKYHHIFQVLIRSDRIDPVHKAQVSRRVLEHAFSENQQHTVAVLLECGHAGDDYVWILHKAVQEDWLEIITRLVLDHGVDVNAPDGFGKSPLRLAFEQQNMESMIRLLELEADLSVLDDDELHSFLERYSGSWFCLKQSVANEEPDLQRMEIESIGH